jgi:hypothetical protein
MRRQSISVRAVGFSVFAATALLATVTFGLAAEAEGKPDKVFRAGAAASNITPRLGLPIVGNFKRPTGTHVHDELHAKCIVLDDGQTTLALVIVDNIGIRQEVCAAAKEKIQEQTDIPPQNVLIAGTHTHSSVAVGVVDGKLADYSEFLVMRIADGVRRAIGNLEPARIGRGSAQVPGEVFNRRYLMKPGTPVPNPFGGVDQVRMNPGRGNPNILKAAGPTDPEIAFLSIQAADGRPIALLANYSLHYVGPAAGAVYSADYFGVFGDRIQELLGADRLDPPFVGIMSNGTSADINNINWPKKAVKRWGPYEKMTQVAEVCAQAVHKAHQDVQFHDDVTLAAAKQQLTLAARKPTDEQVAYAREVLAKPEDAKRYHGNEVAYAHRVLSQNKASDETMVVLQALRIGDWGVCAIPFEVFAEIGLELKAESPLGPTFVVSHANGSNGYLPTTEQHKLGGYETWLGTNRVEFEAASKITDRLLVMLKSLKK